MVYFGLLTNNLLALVLTHPILISLYERTYGYAVLPHQNLRSSGLPLV